MLVTNQAVKLTSCSCDSISEGKLPSSCCVDNTLTIPNSCLCLP